MNGSLYYTHINVGDKSHDLSWIEDEDLIFSIKDWAKISRESE